MVTGTIGRRTADEDEPAVEPLKCSSVSSVSFSLVGSFAFVANVSFNSKRLTSFATDYNFRGSRLQSLLDIPLTEMHDRHRAHAVWHRSSNNRLECFDIVAKKLITFQ